MNKLSCLIEVFFICGVCSGQNLVPNGDFEQYSGCPNNLSQLDSALFWFNPTLGIFPVGSSPDYFNQCVTFCASVPTNCLGFQNAFSGSGYGGLIPFTQETSPDYREYAEVPLTTTLIANSCYHFEMYVNLANNSKYATDDLGVYFSNTIISGVSNFLPLPFTPQINNSTGYITDTLNWTLVQGNYTATGGENYLIIGNFKYDANTSLIITDSFALYSQAYFYIDNVSLTLCPTGINENENNEIANLFPNPFSDKINITVKRNELVEVNLYDVTSRKIFNQSFTNSTSINTEQLAKGIYLYEVRNKNGVIKKGKVVKD